MVKQFLALFVTFDLRLIRLMAKIQETREKVVSQDKNKRTQPMEHVFSTSANPAEKHVET